MNTHGTDDDLANLRERLRYLSAEAQEPLVFVLGAGMSRGSIPDVAAMTDRFLDILTPSTKVALRERWKNEATDTASMYQAAALAVGAQRGDKALGNAIRRAVLEAYSGDHPNVDSLTAAQARDLLEPAAWNITAAHRGLANFIASMPPGSRRAVITTNFDPLLEVALLEAGIESHPIPVPYDNPPGVDSLAHEPTLPILHIHGYFTDSWSQNAINHIRGARPLLEDVLGSLITGATVVVIGYGGWEDSFMRVLARHARQRTIFNAEVLWCSFSRGDELSRDNQTVRELLRGPGFSLYRGIDASSLFEKTPITANPARKLAAPTGWTALPFATKPTTSSRRRFAEGAAPSWSDAAPGTWPELEQTEGLRDLINSALQGEPSRLFAVIGPMGEGKSTAIRQIASSMAQNESYTVFWREQGAPRLRDWLTASDRGFLGPTLFCLDEADLAPDDLLALADASENDASIVVLAACQDRLWWRLPVARRDLFAVEILEGLTPQDATALADKWVKEDLTSGTRLAGMSPRAISRELQLASTPTSEQQSSTLFGAILQVRDSENLQDRVHDLMNKLYGLGITKSEARNETTLGDIFAMICVLEHYWGAAGRRSEGASRQLVGEAARIKNEFESGAILRALGREASITFAGEYVFSRHPVIAASVVDWLRTTGRFDAVCRFTARAGGRMKVDGFERAAFAPAYKLASRLESGDAAREAAAGAVQGAPNYLEPRISYLSVVRRFDTESASRYAEVVTRAVRGSRDTRTAMRVLLNELAILDIKQGRLHEALGIAGLILHNGTGASAKREEVSYGLGSLANALSKIIRAGGAPEKYLSLANRIDFLAAHILDAASHDKYIASNFVGVDLTVIDNPKSVNSALNTLAADLSPLAKDAIAKRELPFAKARVKGESLFFPGWLDFGDLLTLAD